MSSPARNLIQQLIFGGPDTSDVEDIEETIDALDAERPQTGNWPSVYVVVLQETINTVFEHEKHLLTEYELDAIARWDFLSYFGQYCLARLLNRKANQWHTLASLQTYHKEVGGEEGVMKCIAGICVPFKDMVKTESDSELDVEQKPEPIVEEDSNFIDLTLLSDDEEVKPIIILDDQPPYDTLQTNAEAGPSTLPPAVEEDPTQRILNSNPGQLNLDFFCEDESKMTLPEILELLRKDRLMHLVRQTKCPVNSKATKPVVIKALLAHASTQSVLDFKTHTSRKGKGKVSKDGLRQTTLSFFSSRKQEKRPKGSQLDRLRAMALKLLGKCVRVNYDFFRLVRRLHVIYFRSSDHPTGTLLLPAILTRFKKRTYADYTTKRNKCIWSSREELLEYEQALELRMVLDEAVNPTPPKSRWGRKKTKTPAPVKKEKFVTPVPGRPGTASLKTPRSCASVRFADGPDAKQEDEEVVVDDVEEEAYEELVITEDEKVLRARAVKKYYEDWLKDRWYGYLAVKQEPGLQPRLPALERFEPGWVYTSMVYKVSKALKTLKEYTLEEEVLNALLAQRVWRRGKRGAWYERRVLIQTNYLCKGEPEELSNGKTKAPIDERVLQRAVNGLHDALKDDDVGLVWRPGFVRRLQKLEKRLKIEPELCIQVTGTLRIAEVVEFAARRCIKSLKVDSNGRPISEKENTSVGVDSYFTSVGGCKKAEAEKVAPKEKWKPTGKSVWEGRDKEQVTVETRALQYYEDMGFKGFHSETRIVTTIFALLFWDVIFADIPGAFETPYQSAPMDLTEDSFYCARKEMIEQRLSELREGKAREILERHDDKYRAKETWCVGVRWDLCPKQDLVEIVECLGGESLAIICRLFCDDYGGRSSGVPDLIVWKGGVCKFVEVKGPGDRLQENQKLWSDTLLRANTEVEMCKVLDAAQPVKSTAKRKRKSKTPASTSKPKRRKAVADTYSEDEQDYDQLDRHPESEEEDVLPHYDDEPPPKKRRRTVGYEREMEVDKPPLFAFPSTATPPSSLPRLSPKSRVISVNHASEVEVVA